MTEPTARYFRNPSEFERANGEHMFIKPPFSPVRVIEEATETVVSWLWWLFGAGVIAFVVLFVLLLSFLS